MNPRVLYIASGGIRHPLIISQVVRYLKQLSSTFEVCHLVTLEREPFTDEERQQISDDLANYNIFWHGQKSYPWLRALNIWREIWTGYRDCFSLIKKHDLNLIHARSFIPGNIALRLVKKNEGIKFLYDMRGFWTDEKVAKGTIKSNLIRKQAQKMEDRLFNQSDALVSLSNAGKGYLIEKGIKTPISVIPCCCDTNMFSPPDVQPSSNKINSLITAGSLGAGYLPESVFGLFAAAKARNPDCELHLLTRTNHEFLEQVASKVGCDMQRVSIKSVKPSEVAGFLKNATAGIVMNQANFDKIACSPTKLAECLACGLPVFANCKGIGDMEDIIINNQVGVVVEEQGQESWQRAVEEMVELLADENLRQRCRDLAVRRFSVDVGVATYAKIYERLTDEI